MKTLTRSAKKPQRSLVPITAFEFESFGVRVRRVARHRPVPTGVFACQNSPASQDNAVEVFLPSPSLQGLGAMCLRSEARPAAHSVALPSGNSSCRCQRCCRGTIKTEGNSRSGSQLK
jgi:hypothetical protein